MRYLAFLGLMLLTGCHTFYERGYQDGYDSGYAIKQKSCEEWTDYYKAQIKSDKIMLRACQDATFFER